MLYGTFAYGVTRPVKFMMNRSYMLIFGIIFMAILVAFTLNLLPGGFSSQMRHYEANALRTATRE